MPFNRTNLESKLLKALSDTERNAPTFNRTNLESKHTKNAVLEMFRQPFNRTNLESKHLAASSSC